MLYIPVISSLAIIHSQHHFSNKSSDQIKLLLFSPQRYEELIDGRKPVFNGIASIIRYTLSCLATSKYGNAIFMNYSNYVECGRRIDFDENYIPLYNKLPKVYQKRINEIYDW